MSFNWYFAKDEQKVGPFTFDQLKQLAKSGALASKTMVWNEGATIWVPAEVVPGLVARSFAKAVHDGKESRREVVVNGAAESKVQSKSQPSQSENRHHNRLALHDKGARGWKTWWHFLLIALLMAGVRAYMSSKNRENRPNNAPGVQRAKLQDKNPIPLKP